MNEPHGVATSGLFTYGLGVIAAILSRTTLNDWLIFLSLVLVVLRIIYESYEFMQRRADRKKLKRYGVRGRG